MFKILLWLQWMNSCWIFLIHFRDKWGNEIMDCFFNKLLYFLILFSRIHSKNLIKIRVSQLLKRFKHNFIIDTWRFRKCNHLKKYKLRFSLGGGQNLERRNVEQPIFRNFKIANIKITKDESFHGFIFEFISFVS